MSSNPDLLDQYYEDHPDVLIYMKYFGALMFHIVGIMGTLGLTNFNHYVQTYLTTESHEDSYAKDVVHWLRWITSTNKNRELNNEKFPKELVMAAQHFQVIFTSERLHSTIEDSF